MQLAGAPFAPASPATPLAGRRWQWCTRFQLVGTLNTVGNLMLGRSGKWLDPKAMTRRIDDLAQRYELEFDVAKPVRRPSVASVNASSLEVAGGQSTLLFWTSHAVLPPREVGALLSICRKVTLRDARSSRSPHKLAEAPRSPIGRRC